MSYGLQDQAYNVVPPRRVDGGFQLTVDSTSRTYDIGSLQWGGVSFDSQAADKCIFLTLHAETADVYFRFRADNSADGNQATVIAAGGTVTLQTAFMAHIAANAEKDVRIDRLFDRYLEVKTSAGTATLRVNMSSNPPR